MKIADFLIESINERCAALAAEIDGLLVRHSSPGALSLLRLIRDVNNRISGKIHEHAIATRNTLTADQLIQSLNRFAELLPTLHELLSFLEGAERKGSFFPFVHPLSRLLNKHIENCGVVFASRAELNYSVDEVANPIRNILKPAGLDEACKDFPEQFFIISFPRAEAENIFLHCIFAHEIGHAAPLKEQLIDKILRSLPRNRKAIARLSSELLTAQRGSIPLNQSSIQIREEITEEITKSATNWAEELTSDAIAVCLFGPAYLFAFIQLTSSLQLLDNCSETHPSPRLRLRLVCGMMDKLKYTKHFPLSLRRYYAPWKKEAASPLQVDRPILKLVSQAFERVLSKIIQQTLSTMTPQYTASMYAEDIKSLPRLIIAGILPIEVVKDRKKRVMETQSLISILNAGWLVNLTALREFATFRHLPPSDTFTIRRKLQEEVSKALELQEITTRWGEIRKELRDA